MTWQPQHKHVTQLHANGSGQADCWAASLARYLYEAGKAPQGRDPFDLINEIDVVMRGVPDNPNNPPTTLSEASRSLQHYGLPVQWTESYQSALNSPWAICLVNGIELAPEQYPAGWFGGENYPDHFILWLPAYNGLTNYFNDPLVPSDVDVEYYLTTVALAFGGAYLLPSTNHGETAPVWAKLTRAAALKSQPTHTSVAITQMPRGGAGIEEQGTVTTAGEVWRKFQFRSWHGWVPQAYLQPVAVP